MSLAKRFRAAFSVAAILLGVLIPPPTAALKTSDVFIVGSSCDVRREFVDTMAEDALEMAKATIGAIDVVLKGDVLSSIAGDTKKGRRRIAKTLQAFFALEYRQVDYKPKNTAIAKKVKGRYEAIRKYLEGRSEGDSRLRLECDDSWGTIVDTVPVGEPFGDEGQPIQMLNGFENEEFAVFDAGWQSELQSGLIKQSLFPAPGWTRQGFCASHPRHGGQHVESHQLIFFCPNLFGTVPEADGKSGRTIKQTIRRFADGTERIETNGGQYLDDYFTPAAELLHEMTHQVSETNDEIGYGFEKCKGKDGIENADSYALFATAMWLGQYAWHTGVAATL